MQHECFDPPDKRRVGLRVVVALLFHTANCYRPEEIMNCRKYLVKTSAVAMIATATLSTGPALAECASDALPGAMAKPDGFPARALTMIVPYGPAGGSGQVARAMAEAVSNLTNVSINRDHKPGGSGTVGMAAYMACLLYTSPSPRDRG